MWNHSLFAFFGVCVQHGLYVKVRCWLRGLKVSAFTQLKSIRDMQLPLAGKTDAPKCASSSSTFLWGELILPYHKNKPDEPEQVK